MLPTFPFGSDFTKVEQRLIPALDALKHASSSKTKLAWLAFKGATAGAPPQHHASALERMGLSVTATMQERAYRWLVRGALIDSDEVNHTGQN